MDVNLILEIDAALVSVTLINTRTFSSTLGLCVRCPGGHYR